MENQAQWKESLVELHENIGTQGVQELFFSVKFWR